MDGEQTRYRIKFYDDRPGHYPVESYIKELAEAAATNKDARIRLKKITTYMAYLRRGGVGIGEPYVKSIKGADKLWELRPGGDRVFFFFWVNDTYVLLHHFQKKSNKTPVSEIEQAKREMEDYLTRKGEPKK
jgi:phage-related protein